jgi:hypothetical protein
MPWLIRKRENEFCVYKEGPDGDPTGESLGCHPTQAAAEQQRRALHAAENRTQEVTGAMRMNDLRPAPPDVLAVVGRQISSYFPHLANARLAVMVRDRAVEDSGGKVTVAAAGVNPGDPNVPFEYVVWFAEEVWRGLSDGDRDAIVFHELSHCGRDESGKPELTPADAHVFNKEVELYGVWWQDAQKRYHDSHTPPG